MANKKHSRNGGDSKTPPVNGTKDLPTGPTGRYLVTMVPGSQRKLIKSLKDAAGVTAASTADFDQGEVSAEDLGQADGLILEHLGIAIVSADPDQIQSLEMSATDDNHPVVAVEAEEYVHAINDEG